MEERKIQFDKKIIREKSYGTINVLEMCEHATSQRNAQRLVYSFSLIILTAGPFSTQKAAPIYAQIFSTLISVFAT